MTHVNKQAVQFDVLLRGHNGAGTPSVATIDNFKPKFDDIVRTERWFTAHGVTVYKTEFGLSCSAPREVFESIFDVKLSSRTDPGSGTVFYLPEGSSLRIPEELADIIDQVTLTVSPEFF